MSRTARIERQTSESKVLVEVNIDGTGRHDISTGVGFYDHMLTAFARARTRRPDGPDRGRRPHRRAPHRRGHRHRARPGAARGARVTRRGSAASATRPCRSTRRSCTPSSTCRAAPTASHTGEPEGQQYVQLGGSGVSYLGSLTRHVFESIACHGHFALHVRVLAGREPHHIVETQFKAFARAFRDAVALDPARDRHPVHARARCDPTERPQAVRRRPGLRLRQPALRRARRRARRRGGDR